MRKMMFSIASAIPVLMWVLPASSLVVQSEFGFQITLPSNWAVVSKNDVKDKPDVIKGTFEAAEKSKTLVGFPKDLYGKLKEMIVGGQVEYYYKTDSPHINISVYQEPGKIVQSSVDVEETCDLLPKELTKISKKNITVHECRFRQVGNTMGLYVVADAFQGGRYAQYMVQKSPEQVLLFTATGKDQDFEAVRSEFDKVMKSFKVSQ